AAGLAHARLVVLTLVRPQTAERIARAVLERRPTLPLVVATDRVTDAQLLRNLPNVRLYPLYLALGLGLAEQVLLMLGINADYVNRRIEELRQTLSESGGDRP
ncbi:sodium:proton exchanger, partial [Acinetobacter baumannii]